MGTYRLVFGVSITALFMSMALGILIFIKRYETDLFWAQQSLLWTGLLGMCVGNVLKLQEKRISKLEKQASKNESVEHL